MWLSSKRRFLQAAGVAIADRVLPRWLLGGTPPDAAKTRKIILVTFGGGVRYSETFSPEGLINIPQLAALRPVHDRRPAKTTFPRFDQGFFRMFPDAIEPYHQPTRTKPLCWHYYPSSHHSPRLPTPDRSNALPLFRASFPDGFALSRHVERT